MTSEKGIMLLASWLSPFGQRARIALAEKGVQYEYRDENLFEKSDLLLKFNPVHKKIPVMIHDGKPICESMIIVQYIDQVWPEKAPLLPSDPYHRAQALFWADFLDKKFASKHLLWRLRGEGQEAARMEIVEILQKLEAQLGNNKYFGGDRFGFVDVAFIPFSSWFYTFETFGNFTVEAVAPKIVAWVKRCMERDSVSKNLSDPNDIHEYVCFLAKKFGK